MKVLNSVIGILIIFIGALLMNITVYNETFKTVTYKIVGFIILFGGVFYLKKIAKFGKQ